MILLSLTCYLHLLSSLVSCAKIKLQMPAGREVIALAGAGDLGRYISEELLASRHFDLVILTRGVCVAPARHDKTETRPKFET